MPSHHFFNVFRTVRNYLLNLIKHYKQASFYCILCITIYEFDKYLLNILKEMELKETIGEQRY